MDQEERDRDRVQEKKFSSSFSEVLALSANRELHDVKDWIDAIMLWTIPGP